MNYIAVESVDEFSKKIKELGGRIVVPKMEVPGVGWWSLVVDPDGNQFAIIEEIEK